MYQFPHIDYNDHILCIELLPSGGSTTDKENHNDCGNPRGGSQGGSQNGRRTPGSSPPGSGPSCQARALNKVWINSNFIESKDNFKYEGIS